AKWHCGSVTCLIKENQQQLSGPTSSHCATITGSVDHKHLTTWKAFVVSLPGFHGSTGKKMFEKLALCRPLKLSCLSPMRGCSSRLAAHETPRGGFSQHHLVYATQTALSSSAVMYVWYQTRE